MRAYREEKRPIIYMDETYLHSSHTHQKGWSDNSNEGLRKPISKGNRLIIINAGGEIGFVPGAYARWKSNSSTGDYHEEMNYENFEKWATTQLIPNLPEKAVVLVDNAPYHNKQQERHPTSATRKDDMKKWLRERGIQFNDNVLKPELYGIIKNYKPRYISYKIDKLFIDRGFDVAIKILHSNSPMLYPWPKSFLKKNLASKNGAKFAIELRGEDSDTESEYSSAEELDFDALEGIEELDDESVPNQSEKVESSSKQNILSGFRATGLCPLNRNEVLKHLPGTVVEVHLTEENRALLNSFSEICQQTNIANSERVSVKRKKKFDVPAGQSVSVKDLADTTAQNNEEIAVESDEAEDIEDEDSLEAGPSGVSNLEEPPHEVEPDKDILHINSFVLVQFVYDKGSKKEKYKEFVAQIVDIDAPRNLYTVKCMCLYGEKKEMFVFPSIEDLCKITLNQIKKKLSPPVEKAPKKHKTTVTAPLPGSTEGFSAVLPPTVTQTQCESPERRRLETHPSIAPFLHYITSQSITVVAQLSGIGLLNSDYPKRN
ncbi:hypothetical protein GEV33_008878 [Tenebrio molitor]|uniref:Tc1-like transposase DDE domain-containing protein n=1 Tax=Tenebrio molitor TaxID=7067 RepID=A0A8J6HGC9_TENMO|nr:hypothetical protein GEV33_008878 [Tenebrio molitor]